MKTKTLWKSMKSELCSDNGNIKPWKVGEWRKHKGKLEMCESGFHASENVIDAMGYVAAEIIAQVKVRGKHLEQDDKQVWSEMRVIKAWDWTKEDSVSLAVYAAELVIGIYEEKYPGDNRPRQAIEAAKAWLKNPCDKMARDAYSASAAARAAASAAARAAASAAAGAAAWAARAASWTARYAAEIAAWTARYAAESAAWSVADKDIMDKCHAFVITRLETKEEK